MDLIQLTTPSPVFQAVQLTGEISNFEEVAQWCGGRLGTTYPEGEMILVLLNPSPLGETSVQELRAGDWVIQLSEGSYGKVSSEDMASSSYRIV